MAEETIRQGLHSMLPDGTALEIVRVELKQGEAWHGLGFPAETIDTVSWVRVRVRVSRHGLGLGLFSGLWLLTIFIFTWPRTR